MHGQGLDTGSASPPVLTVQQVRHIHVLAATPVWDVAPHPDATERETPGDFREHDIRAFPGGMTPPSHVLVAPRLRDWLDAAAAIGGSTDHVLDGVARLHVEFEQIHPLLDGNGRTGRLITNLVLARHGYPPAIVQARERDEYLKALRHADRGSCGAMGELLARAVLDDPYRFAVPALAGPARLVPLAALETPDLSRVALRNAAQRGRLAPSEVTTARGGAAGSGWTSTAGPGTGGRAADAQGSWARSRREQPS